MKTLLASSLLIASTGAFAQSQLSASVSLFRPLTGGFRSQTGDLGFGLALDYTVKSNISVELGFARVGGTQHVDTLSALVVGRYPLSADNRWFGIVGAGGYRHSARTGHDSLNKIGGMLGLGTKVGERMTAELGYRISGSYIGASSDAVFVRLRFGF